MQYAQAPQQFTSGFQEQLNQFLLRLFIQYGVEEEMLTPELVQAFTPLSDENAQLRQNFNILQVEFMQSLNVFSL